MIRLGSLAGYPFDGPRLLGGWTPPPVPAVYAVLYKPDPDARPERYAVIYIGHADDLTAERLPFRHPLAACWVRRAGSRWKLYVATYQVPGGARPHRELISRELLAVYRPRCNAQQYDAAWRQQWIGRYSAPTVGPLTPRGPAGRGQDTAAGSHDTTAGRHDTAAGETGEGPAGQPDTGLAGAAEPDGY